jgi:hypothetical protein
MKAGFQYSLTGHGWSAVFPAGVSGRHRNPNNGKYVQRMIWKAGEEKWGALSHMHTFCSASETDVTESKKKPRCAAASCEGQVEFNHRE